MKQNSRANKKKKRKSAAKIIKDRNLEYDRLYELAKVTCSIENHLK